MDTQAAKWAWGVTSGDKEVKWRRRLSWVRRREYESESRGWGFSSVAQRLPGTSEVVSSIPRPGKKKKAKVFPWEQASRVGRRERWRDTAAHQGQRRARPPDRLAPPPRPERSALQQAAGGRRGEAGAPPFPTGRTAGSPALPPPPPHHLQPGAAGAAGVSLRRQPVPRRLGAGGPRPGHRPERGQNPGLVPEPQSQAAEARAGPAAAAGPPACCHLRRALARVPRVSLLRGTRSARGLLPAPPAVRGGPVRSAPPARGLVPRPAPALPAAPAAAARPGAARGLELRPGRHGERSPGPRARGSRSSRGEVRNKGRARSEARNLKPGEPESSPPGDEPRESAGATCGERQVGRRRGGIAEAPAGGWRRSDGRPGLRTALRCHPRPAAPFTPSRGAPSLPAGSVTRPGPMICAMSPSLLSVTAACPVCFQETFANALVKEWLSGRFTQYLSEQRAVARVPSQHSRWLRQEERKRRPRLGA
ncbi:PREDICTED: translation initiation factor IF-2-like [Chinchilla lanigera]|uniref:translation initiation factor IF-2-like n=1 Tax=Chinchilla lanigera TaxID=34839 RepID=UPI0006981D90|nr:PREDICTED: translation initiation factor IF-2-like [Chinchilla lanigera]